MYTGKDNQRQPKPTLNTIHMIVLDTHVKHNTHDRSKYTR